MPNLNWPAEIAKRRFPKRKPRACWGNTAANMLYPKGWFAENAVPCTDEPLGLKRARKKLSGVASAALSSARSIASTLQPYPRKHYIRQSCSAFKPWPVTRMISCKTSGMSKRTLSSFPGAKSLLNHWKSKSTSWSRKCPP